MLEVWALLLCISISLVVSGKLKKKHTLKNNTGQTANRKKIKNEVHKVITSYLSQYFSYFELFQFFNFRFFNNMPLAMSNRFINTLNKEIQRNCYKFSFSVYNLSLIQLYKIPFCKRSFIQEARKISKKLIFLTP